MAATTTTTTASSTSTTETKTENCHDQDVQHLFRAIRKGKAHLTRFMLAASNTLLNCWNREGRTPLIECCYIREEVTRLNMMKIVRDAGADVNMKDNKGCTALIHACQQRCNDVVRILIMHYRIVPDLEDKEGNTALIHSASIGNDVAVELLVRNFRRLGLQIDHFNNNGYTALHIAAKSGFLQCAKILATKGKAGLTLKDKVYQMTPLEWCLSEGYQKSEVEFLKPSAKFYKVAKLTTTMVKYRKKSLGQDSGASGKLSPLKTLEKIKPKARGILKRGKQSATNAQTGAGATGGGGALTKDKSVEGSSQAQGQNSPSVPATPSKETSPDKLSPKDAEPATQLVGQATSAEGNAALKESSNSLSVLSPGGDPRSITLSHSKSAPNSIRSYGQDFVETIENMPTTSISCSGAENWIVLPESNASYDASFYELSPTSSEFNGKASPTDQGLKSVNPRRPQEQTVPVSTPSVENPTCQGAEGFTSSEQQGSSQTTSDLSPGDNRGTSSVRVNVKSANDSATACDVGGFQEEAILSKQPKTTDRKGEENAMAGNIGSDKLSAGNKSAILGNDAYATSLAGAGEDTRTHKVCWVEDKEQSSEFSTADTNTGLQEGVTKLTLVESTQQGHDKRENLFVDLRGDKYDSTVDDSSTDPPCKETFTPVERTRSFPTSKSTENEESKHRKLRPTLSEKQDSHHGGVEARINNIENNNGQTTSGTKMLA